MTLPGGATVDGIGVSKLIHDSKKKTTTKTPTIKPPKPAPSGGAVSGGGGGGGAPAKETKKKLSMKELAAQYGYAAALFKSDPELKKLIEKAVKGQWSTARFKAELMNTKWYRNHTASARAWLELEASQPAEAKKRIDDQLKAIKQMASQMGIALSTSRARKMARESLMMGWNQQTLINAIVDEFEYKPGKTSGATATLEAFIKRNAADFGVTVSDSRVGEWLARALRGDITDDHLLDMIRDMARSKYPGLAPYIDQGMTVADVAEPYLQSYSQILEVPIESVTLFDPLVQRALQGTQSAAKPGEPPRLQSLFEFERELRRDSRWQYTKNAHKATMDATLTILKDMGLFA